MSNRKLPNVVDPSNPQDAATKAYVDATTAPITSADGSLGVDVVLPQFPLPFLTLATIAAVVGTAFQVAWSISGEVGGGASVRIQVLVDGVVTNGLGGFLETVNGGAGGGRAFSGILRGLAPGPHSFALQGVYSGAGAFQIKALTNPVFEHAKISAIQVTP